RDWSSDVCSSDLQPSGTAGTHRARSDWRSWPVLARRLVFTSRLCRTAGRTGAARRSCGNPPAIAVRQPDLRPGAHGAVVRLLLPCGNLRAEGQADRKSTRLNSSHVKISYAVFCL